MIESIVVSCVSALATIIAVLISNNATKTVLEYRVDELTREVREYKEDISKLPTLRAEITHLKESVARIEEQISR